MKYQLVLQFPASTEEDFDKLIALEDSLEAAFKNAHDVDGHDFGSGEMNVFIFTNDPKAALGSAKDLIESSGLNLQKAAYRDVEGEDYTLLFPEDSNEPFKVV